MSKRQRAQLSGARGELAPPGDEVGVRRVLGQLAQQGERRLDVTLGDQQLAQLPER